MQQHRRAAAWGRKQQTRSTTGGGNSRSTPVVGAGNGEYGRLGNGAEMSSAEPVAVLGGQAFTRLAAGNDHTCGISGTPPLRPGSQSTPPSPPSPPPLPPATLEQRWLFGSSPVRCLVYSPFTGQWGEVAAVEVPSVASINEKPWPKRERGRGRLHYLPACFPPNRGLRPAFDYSINAPYCCCCCRGYNTTQ